MMSSAIASVWSVLYSVCKQGCFFEKMLFVQLNLISVHAKTFYSVGNDTILINIPC